MVGWNILKTSMSEVNRRFYRKFSKYLCSCFQGAPDRSYETENAG